MKTYEYRFMKFESQKGFDYEQMMKYMEQKWSELGLEGWKFCTERNGCTIFMRELERS